MAAMMGHRTVSLTAIEFQRAAFIETNGPHVLQAVLATAAECPAILNVFSEAHDIALASPHVSMRVEACAENREPPVDLAALRQRCPDTLSAARFYDELRTNGNEYGTAFQGIAQLWRGPREAIATVRVPVSIPDVGDFHVHPVLLDSCMQLALAADDVRDHRGSLLVSIDSLQFFHSPGSRCWAHAHHHPADGPAGETVADVRLFNASGELLVDLRGVRFRALAAAHPSPRQAEANALTVAVSATFTAEPLKDSLAFWMRELEMPANVVFAPYNQPFQQLLDPHSVLATNRNGLNVMLLRVEDWIPRDHRDGVRAGRSAEAALASTPGTPCLTVSKSPTLTITKPSISTRKSFVMRRISNTVSSLPTVTV